MDKVTLFWFRRDLRLDDNHGLFKALEASSNVVPIFIFDKNILDKLPRNDARVHFIHQQITQINEQLKKHNSSILTFFSTPSEVFEKLSDEMEIEAVYCNRDYEPYGINRDLEISNFLNTKNISFHSFKDHVIFEENEIIKADGTPYKVYTPYSKKWLSTLTKESYTEYPSLEKLNNCFSSKQTQILTIDEIGFTESDIKIPTYNIKPDLIDEYEAKRNFPGIDATSKLGIHLRFGSISTRKAVIEAKKSKNITFLKELIWREFFMQILWHYPHTVQKSFKPKYEGIAWRNNEDDFKRWCEGKTGYPLVDAGMRELNKTGFMHNRVRMLVGSFLCKHLLIDWRWGEAYFAEKLLDFELASNVGNWQWVAGCGVDAAPYFRIFNPTTQIQKFDKQLTYIKKWVPEFQELTYEREIVDHKFARERCLDTYKKALTTI
ncbi:cryptochrome/photolyase family protein [Tenacibaculum sp. M341]|uniref:cryptochrome/photolyase family protein n=1 Tax=Tenacibaculum sp. M341 TaxID=2530339 RepID=UPI0010471CD4|nr:deoxyribodipyrimidine photo-lyase [Tenacibaculum sp. M341]TCI91771.1 deoxyribodipyrimidine photo-lyase [Tenacibaculum sp. M341]